MVLSTIIYIVSLSFRIYFYILFAYIIMSWIGGRDSPIGMTLQRIVEPYLSPFRKIIPPLGMIDFSPIVAIFALRFLERGVITVINWVAGMFS